jgi:hypothetical protein
MNAPVPGREAGAWLETGEQLHVEGVAGLKAMRRVDCDHRAIGLVVHGVGEQPRGSTLEHLLDAFLPLIRARLDRSAGVAITPADAAGTAEGCIWFKYNEAQYELRLKEAWWAQCFEACSLGDFLAGALEFSRAVVTPGRGRRSQGPPGLRSWVRGLFGNVRPRSLIDVPLGLERLLVDAVAVFLAVPLVGLLIVA